MAELNIPKDTLMELIKIAADVMTMGTGLSKIADGLCVKAGELGKGGVAVSDTQRAEHAVSEATTKSAASALWCILVSM
ncbi:hypothetical protein ERJ75_001580100 [Trypanosoma vivax]|nr:hypothetical protein ERJ75_001580100 [Trypanosoma vivax]